MQLDEPVIFYLKHQRQINEWAQLRKRAIKATRRFLESLPPVVQDRVSELGPDVHCIAMTEIEYPKIFLCRAHWCDRDPKTLHDQKDVKRIRTAIGLEWYGSSVLLSSDESWRLPYMGVWFHEKHEGYSSLEPELRSLVAVPKGATKNKWWAFYRPEPWADDEVWNHLDKYREQLVNRILELWNDYENSIEEALRSIGVVA